MHFWKVPQFTKGALSFLPMLDAWRLSHAATGGSGSARYCYSVWLRHLTLLGEHGFRLKDARIGELGPGDSVGTGIAALLSGAKSYVALDLLPFSAKADLNYLLHELSQMFLKAEPIPAEIEFPGIRPKLESYEFPSQYLDCLDISGRVSKLELELNKGLANNSVLQYKVPWNSPEVIARGSLDLVFSQAVLEHVDAIDETYLAMSEWLTDGGYASHVIDFGAHHLSPHWNGHWAFDDFEWRIVRGRREFLLNREPLSRHLLCAEKSGFELLYFRSTRDDNGLPDSSLAPQFRERSEEDRRTRGVVLVLKKRR